MSRAEAEKRAALGLSDNYDDATQDDDGDAQGAASGSGSGKSGSYAETMAKIAKYKEERRTRDALREAKLVAQQNIDKAREVGEASERLSDSATSFAEKVKQLRRQQQNSWF